MRQKAEILSLCEDERVKKAPFDTSQKNQTISLNEVTAMTHFNMSILKKDEKDKIQSEDQNMIFS